MSQSSSSTINTKVLPELSAVEVDNKIISTETRKGTKRVAPLAAEGQVKKRIIDYHPYEEQAGNGTAKSVDQLKFVSASELVVKARTNVDMMPEISDQELLEMAIKFEKEHPQ